MNPEPPTPRVTINGLHLGLNTEQVVEKMGEPNFRSESHGARIMEYWSDRDRPQLIVWSDSSDRVYKLEGGIPEVDGENALRWSPSQLQVALGPALHGGHSRLVGREGHTFLSYPSHRLLVQQEGEKNRFILFRSGRE